MAPTWLTSVAWAYLSLCFICAGIIAYDIAVNRRRQPLGVMNAVYPITALYLGPFALAFYRRWGRTAARTTMAPGSESQAPADRPWWAMMAMEVSHCGSGCVLGDVISEFSIFGLALTVALTAFEIGLFGWMAVMAFVLFPAPNHLMPNTAAYWLLMQIGMIIGFATSWPANVWLVNRGIKVAM